MQYIKLASGQLIIHTSEGTKQMTSDSFNYVAVLRKLEEGCSEESIMPLLETPELVDGIYKLYLLPASNEMVYVHYVTDSSGVTRVDEVKNLNGEKVALTKDAKFVGNYTSMQGIEADWPEYIV